MFDVFQTEDLGAGQGQDTSRGSHDDVGAILLQDFFVLLDGHASEEHSDLDIVDVLAEALILLTDLESQLTSVSQDQNRDLKNTE